MHEFSNVLFNLNAKLIICFPMDIGDWRSGAKFFETEYKLDYLMATYSKPQVTLSYYKHFFCFVFAFVTLNKFTISLHSFANI